MNEQELSQALEKYADVAIQIGINLKKGQRLAIRADTESIELVRKLVKSAYRAGAWYVDVLIVDPQVERIRLELAEPESVTHNPDWMLSRFLEYLPNGEAYLAVFAAKPDLFDGVDPDLLAAYRKAISEKFEPAYKYIMRDEINWSVVSVASPVWAKRVFPELASEEAQARLWQEIFRCCRADLPDPVQAWNEHILRLIKRSDYLNGKCYAALHYVGPGTNLTVGLPAGQRWISGRTKAANGIEFTANIPTEEIFSMAHREQADGHVASSRPLNLGGSVIEDFHITFENGHVSRVIAKKGEADLQKMIETDEGAGRLGEVALVPDSSPISQSKRIFYNILYDENAASHVALGEAYRTNLNGGTELSDEEFQAQGGNKSLIHVDFMIGSSEMDIDGLCSDGSSEPLMRNGEWTFDI